MAVSARGFSSANDIVLLLRAYPGFSGQAAAHRVLPVFVLDEEMALVSDPRSAHQRLQADCFGRCVGTLEPVPGTTREVVPARRAAPVRHLAAAEFREVVRCRHAAGVEKI